MKLAGQLDRWDREDGAGRYYGITTPTGVIAITMAESMKPADDDKVLEPLLGKTVEAEGVLRLQTKQLQAFTVKPYQG